MAINVLNANNYYIISRDSGCYEESDRPTVAGSGVEISERGSSPAASETTASLPESGVSEESESQVISLLIILLLSLLLLLLLLLSLLLLL